MSVVTLGDRAKALELLGSGSGKRDALLLSLARQLSWTDRQRKLVETIWRERQLKKEADMRKKLSCAVLAVAALVGLSGCAATYEKRFTDHDGRTVVITERHDRDWWSTLGGPDWMNVRHETITRDGMVVTERHCRHEPTHPELLDCTR